MLTRQRACFLVPAVLLHALHHQMESGRLWLIQGLPGPLCGPETPHGVDSSYLSFFLPFLS